MYPNKFLKTYTEGHVCPLTKRFHNIHPRFYDLIHYTFTSRDIVLGISKIHYSDKHKDGRYTFLRVTMCRRGLEP